MVGEKAGIRTGNIVAFEIDGTRVGEHFQKIAGDVALMDKGLAPLLAREEVEMFEVFNSTFADTPVEIQSHSRNVFDTWREIHAEHRSRHPQEKPVVPSNAVEFLVETIETIILDIEKMTDKEMPACMIQQVQLVSEWLQRWPTESKLLKRDRRSLNPEYVARSLDVTRRWLIAYASLHHKN